MSTYFLSFCVKTFFSLTTDQKSDNTEHIYIRDIRAYIHILNLEAHRSNVKVFITFVKRAWVVAVFTGDCGGRV